MLPLVLGLGVAALMVATAIAQGDVRVSSGPSPSLKLPLVAAATSEHAAHGTPKPGVSSTPSEVDKPSPSPVESENALPPFHLLNAKSCNPALVPSATAEPVSTPKASKRFVLQVPILMYHRIVPRDQAAGSRPSLVVPPETFDEQLSAAQAAGWHTITVAQLADDLAAGIKPPARTFVITVDDGWKDGYTYALPILEKHGFVATFYVIAARINYGSFLDAWQLRAMVAAGNEIGDHSMTHVAMGKLAGPPLTYQVDAAAATIAEATGRWPVTFSYPSGSHSQTTELAVQACSTMKMAVVEGEATHETWAGRFQTPRLRVDGATSPSKLLDLLAHPAAVAPNPKATSNDPASVPAPPTIPKGLTPPELPGPVRIPV